MPDPEPARRRNPQVRYGRGRVRYPLLVEMDAPQRGEFQEALLDAHRFEDLPSKWQAAILEAEAAGPRLRLVTDI